MLSLLISCTVLLLLACSDSKKDAAPTAPDLGAVSLALINIEFSGDAARALFDGPENTRIVLPTAPCQSTTINLRLDGFVFPRPLTQDLLISAADSLGSPITEVLFEFTDGIPPPTLPSAATRRPNSTRPSATGSPSISGPASRSWLRRR